ncbi:MAG: hypothetical protein JXR36_03850 [Bacteroidales bacterium]|nr:hypothetical protein [Bacteroidales bacterium]
MKYFIVLTTIIMATILTSCNGKKYTAVSEKQINPNSKWYSGVIKTGSFVNKAGVEQPGYQEHYFLCNSGEYFIKKSESHYQLNIKDAENQHVKVLAHIEEGLWDTNDPNVQSRVGPYICIDSIIIIDSPVQIIYNDGSSNAHIISKDNYKYSPVTPQESSSGTYSGGEQREVNINENLFNEIFIKALSIAENKTIHIESRMMGTGMLRIKYENSETQIYIDKCMELENFERFLNNLK